ncbi:uncharacterized protein LOC112567602 [Pomacea canaliculata]|uniref:uncharacterized protein LOC112567602 n=1 Tax=Pomacea canaliculata TaxID=400727 RepID=UPI000D72F1C8|nr:uncharacterized protein LOC112567602 [Pomacea canaliculata]
MVLDYFPDYLTYFFMKIIILLSLLAGVLGQLFPSWSFTPEDGERDFHKYDLNSDGFWQLRELLHVFDSFDINGDRFVTMDEVNRFLPSGYPQRELQGMFKYCEQDGRHETMTRLLGEVSTTFLTFLTLDGECDQVNEVVHLQNFKGTSNGNVQ